MGAFAPLSPLPTRMIASCVFIFVSHFLFVLFEPCLRARRHYETPSYLSLLVIFQEFPPPLALDQFVESVVEQAIQSCETTNEHGVVYCDIKVTLRDVVFCL